MTLKRVWGVASRVSAALGVLLILVTATPLVRWWATGLAGPWNDPTGDVLIVLGGSSEDDGSMGESSFRRSQYGALVFNEGRFREILLSGGGQNGASIANAMREYLTCRGIPPGVIRMEPYSRNTHENALYAKDSLAGHPGVKVLLTSDYHMTRAYLAFRKVGIEVLPRPFPDAIKRSMSFETRWSAFIDVSRETAALAYYFLRRWV